MCYEKTPIQQLEQHCTGPQGQEKELGWPKNIMHGEEQLKLR